MYVKVRTIIYVDRNLFTLEQIFETCAMFQPASTGLDHAMKA